MPDQLDFTFSSAPAPESDREVDVGPLFSIPPNDNLDLFSSVPRSANSTTVNPDHAPLPHLLDEIARIWSLPLGERAESTFRPAFPLPVISGLLELRADPAYPWDARRPLALRVAGQDFTSRDIERWNLV